MIRSARTASGSARALGIACALAAWPLVLMGTGAALFLLVAMRFAERAVEPQDGPPPRGREKG